MPEYPAPERRRFDWLNLLLLLVPFIALLWVPFYNSIEPTIAGIPFFYWYQFIWVFITSGLILWVHRRAG
ncbi:DUF3311 domain-containing protein [Microvirga sp. 2TAF3]|uniref:DUF3311 domain-containing protein n=1 Tax=Microvirga sp. 2TAF3 TaxID=3233014 RepID=UPI003F9CC453